jgi:hypothetical protein
MRVSHGDCLLWLVPGDGLRQIRHDKCWAASQFVCSVMDFNFVKVVERRGIADILGILQKRAYLS